MFKSSTVLAFRMSMGSMFVDYRLTSRDHRRHVRVADALVDRTLPTTVAPLSWLEGLRSPSERLPTGYYKEEAVLVDPRSLHVVADAPPPPPPPSTPATPSPKTKTTTRTLPPPSPSPGKAAPPSPPAPTTPNKKSSVAAPPLRGVRAGPLIMYITGQVSPVALTIVFVPDLALIDGGAAAPSPNDDVNVRVGMDAIAQCTLFNELRPGGLLSDQLLSHISTNYGGLKVPLASSPLNRRPWTRMKHMFIDEIQHGPRLTEFVGHNSREGTPWRFSQHCKHLRVGIWRDTIRKKEFHPGLHGHSSWQKSHQQAVPEVPFMAPSP